MTILNVLVGTNSVAVASDTRAVGADGRRHAVSKLFPVPHLNVLLATRGTMSVSRLMHQCLFGAELKSFDACRANAVRLLTMSVAEAREMVHAADAGPAGQCEVVLVGWSHARCRMAACHLALDVDAQTHELTDLGPGQVVLSPATSLVVQTVPDMVAAATAQLAWMARNVPAIATGGDLLIAEVTRDATTLRNFGRL